MTISLKKKDGQRYTIDGGIVTMEDPKGNIFCDKCKYFLGNIGDKSILIRGIVSVYDRKEDKLLIKCGQCKSFTNVDLTEID